MATSTKIPSLIIENTDFPLLTPTIITQELVEKNGNFIPFDRLAQLRVALDALQPVPPNANTIWFDDTILLQDASGTGDSLTINPTSITSNGNLEIDCQSGIIDAKSSNFNLTNINGGGAIIFLDDVVDNIQMSVEASAGNTGLFTNDGLSFQCENMNTRVSQGTSVIASNTNIIEFQITEDVDNSILRFTSTDPSATIESSNNLSVQCDNMDTVVRQGGFNVFSDTDLMAILLTESVNGATLEFVAEDPIATIVSSNDLTIQGDDINIGARQGNFTVDSDTNRMELRLGENVNGTYLQFVTEDPESIIDSSDDLSVRCGNMNILARQGEFNVFSDTDTMYMTLNENVNGGNLEFIVQNTGTFIGSSAVLAFECENMGVLVRQGNVNMDSDDNRLTLNLAESTNGSALTLVAEDPSARIESNNDLIITSSGNLSLTGNDIYIGSNTAGNIQTSTDNFNMFCAQGNFTGVSGTARMEQVLLDNVGNSLTCSTQSSGASIESSNDFAITSGGNLTFDCSGNLVLDATTIDFQNTTTTTSTANHTALISVTSPGLQTTKFLKVKLNGNDIWIPYFETDPSL